MKKICACLIIVSLCGCASAVQEPNVGLYRVFEKSLSNEAAYANLNEETDFIKDLEINSANLVDVALDVEDAFDITIENEEMEKMLTVKTAIEIITSKVSGK